MSSNRGLESLGAGRRAACLWKRPVLELDVTLEIVLAGVVLATDFARKGDRHVRLLVALQVEFAKEGLSARGGLSALFDLVSYTLGRTRGGRNNGKGGK
jgi:hypothetical protein